MGAGAGDAITDAWTGLVKGRWRLGFGKEVVNYLYLNRRFRKGLAVRLHDLPWQRPLPRRPRLAG